MAAATTSVDRACPRLRRWEQAASGRRLFVPALLIALASASPAYGSGHGGSSEAASGHGAAEAAVDPKQPRTLDLGVFDLRNFRPTHNEIANIRFNLFVAFAPGTSDSAVEEAARWKRRLRDQAITAIRSATPEDLSDPELKKVQRLLLLRLRRLPLAVPVTGVYITDFAVSSG